jgi:hypothetical protein
MAKEVNGGIWKIVSVSNVDGGVVTVHGCGVGTGSLVMTSVKGESSSVDVVFVPDLRLKEIVERDDKGAVKAHYWAFNMGNIG